MLERAFAVQRSVSGAVLRHGGHNERGEILSSVVYYLKYDAFRRQDGSGQAFRTSADESVIAFPQMELPTLTLKMAEHLQSSMDGTVFGSMWKRVQALPEVSKGPRGARLTVLVPPSAELLHLRDRTATHMDDLQLSIRVLGDHIVASQGGAIPDRVVEKLPSDGRVVLEKENLLGRKIAITKNEEGVLLANGVPMSAQPVVVSSTGTAFYAIERPLTFADDPYAANVQVDQVGEMTLILPIPHLL